jgi:hypothetical protein
MDINQDLMQALLISHSLTAIPILSHQIEIKTVSTVNLWKEMWQNR